MKFHGLDPRTQLVRWGLFAIAVGECGLAHHYEHSPGPDQAAALAWVADLCLAPIGLLAATAAIHHIAAGALVIPCAALLMLLNRDRDARIAEALSDHPDNDTGEADV